jgi:chaperonin GroES
MSKTTIQPLYDHVLVKQIYGVETEYGIWFAPDKGLQAGRVIAMGQCAQWLKVNDRVLYFENGGTEVNVEGEEHLIMCDSDILGVIKGGDND